MGISRSRDNRTGIVYVYQTESITDESGKKRTTRKLIGRLDQDGNIVQTSGRKGSLPKQEYQPGRFSQSNAEQEYSKQLDELMQRLNEAQKKNAQLEASNKALIMGLKKLITHYESASVQTQK